MGVNSRADLLAVDASRAAADPRSARACGRHLHRARRRPDRRRRGDRRRHDDLGRRDPARANARRLRLRDRSADDDHRLDARRRRQRPALLPRRLCGRPKAPASDRSPTCGPRPTSASEPRSGRSSRSRSRRSERGRRCPTSRTWATRTSARCEPRRGRDNRQLRRPRQAPHGDRKGRAHVRPHLLRGPGSRRRAARTLALDP